MDRNVNGINEKIVEIWKDFSKIHNGKAPLFYSNFKRECFLSIGLNPSFNTNFLNKIGRKFMQKFDANEFFEWKNAKKNFDEFIEISLKIEKEAMNPKNPYSFYVPFLDIANKIGLEYQSIDMFLLRETSQKNLKAHVCEKKCDEVHPVLNDFGTRQFDLLLEEIQMIKPKIILVANALASRIFKEKLSSSLIWKEEKGTYMLNLNDLTCPIFFSGMLSGQRAMDVFSRERLSWHMEKVVKDKI